MSAKHLKQCTSVLPQDIIQVILLKLPAKSLLRFKTVSRSWYTTISDPVFVQTHLCLSLSEWHSFAKSEEDRKLPTVKLLEGPLGEHDVMCFCGGVLLLTEAKILFRRIVLWNPLSRMETHIWSPDICVGHHRQSYGLCYDPTSHDFKVVVMSPEYYVVFSSKNRFWTQRNKFPYSGELDSCASGVYANGAIYWVWRVWRHRTNVKEIMYFDPRDDKLKMLQKPKDTFVDDDSKLFYLVNLRGCLCLYYCNGGDSNEVRIWTKEKGIDKNCWNQSITVENVDNRIWWFKPHCLADNKIVIRFKDSTRFAFYSPFKNTFEESQCDTSYFGYEFVPYVHGVFFPTRKTRPNKRTIICM